MRLKFPCPKTEPTKLKDCWGGEPWGSLEPLSCTYRATLNKQPGGFAQPWQSPLNPGRTVTFGPVSWELEGGTSHGVECKLTGAEERRTESAACLTHSLPFS